MTKPLLKRVKRSIAPSLKTPKVTDYPKPTKLVYPFPISTGKNGRTERKTWAFTHLGADNHRYVASWEGARQEALAFRKTARKDNHVDFGIVLQLAKSRKDIALDSTHFLKWISPRERAIRERLIKFHIPIEEPVPNVNLGGKNLELFERGDYRQLGDKRHFITDKKCRGVIKQLGAIITRMHVAGIVHGHPHLGNWLVNRKGEVKLIDLSQAKMWNHPPKNKAEFLRRYAKDIYVSSLSAASLAAPVWYEDNLTPFARKIVENWIKMHQQKMKTFGATSEDVFNFVYNT